MDETHSHDEHPENEQDENVENKLHDEAKNESIKPDEKPNDGVTIDRLDGTPKPMEAVKAEGEHDHGMAKFKKYFMYIMIVGFVTAALISIVAILLGEFNEVVVKSLFTVLAIVIHSLLTVAFMSIDHKNKADAVVLYTVFAVVGVSLMTSILGIWSVISGTTVMDIYTACLYAVIAAVIIRLVMRANQIDKTTRMLSNATVGLTVFTYCLLTPSAFINYPNTVPEIYQRVIWATIVLLVTFVVLVFIFNRLFLHQHPEFDTKHLEKTGWPLWVKIVLIVGGVFLLMYIVPLIIGLVSMMSYRSGY